jgi:pescadillo protein
LKGIFPRDPARKVSGSGKTYYLAKDLKFMMHDPLVDKFREHRAWRLKVKKAKARKLKDKVASLLKNEPKYTLIHLVKERYPTFMDALRDLDDAITMIHLFMIMPTKTLKPSTAPKGLESVGGSFLPPFLPCNQYNHLIICGQICC